MLIKTSISNKFIVLISWINYLVNLDPLAEIILFGMNVGAASVMNAVGDYLPRNVKCAIAEGGYKEIKDIIAYLAETGALLKQESVSKKKKKDRSHRILQNLMVSL